MTASTDSDFLASLRIASPCTADWDAMEGDDRVRFCASCALNVFNLSGMTRSEAEALVKNATGRVCVRMLKRADGTVLTKDCPVGLARLRARARRCAALVIGLGLAVLAGCRWKKTTTAPATVAPVQQPVEQPAQVMGDFCPPKPVNPPEEVKGRVVSR